MALARDAGWPEPLGWAFSAAKLVLLPGARQSGYIFCGLPRAAARITSWYRGSQQAWRKGPRPKIEALYAGAPPDWAFQAAAPAAEVAGLGRQRGRSGHHVGAVGYLLKGGLSFYGRRVLPYRTAAGRTR